MSVKYESDFAGWASAQADALSRRSANELDWDNLAEELAALSRSERRELRSRYVVLLAHLAKWSAQPGRRSQSWRLSIRNAREAIADLLAESPSLAAEEMELFARAWAVARREAAAETGLDLAAFAEAPPFTPAEAKDPAFLPD